MGDSAAEGVRSQVRVPSTLRSFRQNVRSVHMQELQRGRLQGARTAAGSWRVKSCLSLIDASKKKIVVVIFSCHMYLSLTDSVRKQAAATLEKPPGLHKDSEIKTVALSSSDRTHLRLVEGAREQATAGQHVEVPRAHCMHLKINQDFNSNCNWEEAA